MEAVLKKLSDFFADREIWNKDTAKSGSVIRILSFLATLYCVLIFFGLPLFFRDRYYDIGDAKYDYFYYTTVIFITLVFLILIFSLISSLIGKRSIRGDIRAFIKGLSIPEGFLLAYGSSASLSFLFSSFNTWEFFGRDITNPPLTGYKGWYMGLISQLFFLTVYFIVSRALFGRYYRKILIFFIYLGSFFPIVFAILHRFGVDPLGFYTNVDPRYYIYFLSTLGQATWYSSFLSIVLPLAMASFIYEKRSGFRILYAGYIFLGAMSLVTQNSDSAFLALFAVLLMFFIFSLDGNAHFINYLQLLILILMAFRFTGLLQAIFSDRAILPGRLSLFFSQGKEMAVICLLLFALYILICGSFSRKNILIKNYRRILIYTSLLLLLFAVLAYLLITFLVSGGYIKARGILSSAYFNFNDTWGNGRGFTWRTSLEMIKGFSFREFFLGVGPDCYAEYAYSVKSEELQRIWKAEILANAHNEWLNTFFTMGALGLFSYLGFFISSICRLIRNKGVGILLTGVSAAVLSYIVHNFFCYQQVLCSPMIFLLIAFANSVIKNKK
ncbi:MAG: O-antigen ligase family protein [Lachnospiraceae bacterium]|nr:O-antigen ligase family protein [Lachnospiraceae bacterium]